MPLPEGVTLIDLRPAELRFAQPLEGRVSGVVRPMALERIEAGTHGLSAEAGPYLVVCERGWRSGLAALLLSAEGLEASAYPGGVSALLREEAARPAAGKGPGASQG